MTSEQINENGGSFEYDEASKLNEDDIICLFVGTKPTERNTEETSELLDPEVYVKVAAIDGKEVTFVALDGK